jgi:Na+-transporting NADH:ubiquinone oxidoreductase subunit NqrE
MSFNRIFDRLTLVGCAILAAAVAVGSFMLSEKYRFPATAVFALWIGGGFVAVVGWSLRSRLKRPTFALFFAAWLIAYIVVTLAAIRFLKVFWLFPVTFLELWIGYALAFWLSGPPRHKKSR